MKLLLTQNQADMGGVSVYLDQLAFVLTKRGHQIHILAQDGAMAEQYHNGAIFTELYPQSDLDIVYIKKLVRYIKDNDIELMLCNMLKAGLNGLIAAKIARIPAIINIHGTLVDWEVSWYKKIPNLVANAVLSNLLATNVIAVSQAMADDIIAHDRIRKQLVQVIPNAIDTDVINYVDPLSIRQKWGIMPGHKVVGSMGRLSIQKDPLRFLELARDLAAKHDDITFVVAGDGPMRPVMEDAAGADGLSARIRFIGQIESGQRAEVLSSFDVFVGTSKRESFGLAIAEAMACTRPVVCYNIPVLHEIIDDRRTGILVDPQRPQELVLEVGRLLDDPGRATTMGNQARETIVSRYGLQTWADSYENLFRRSVRK